MCELLLLCQGGAAHLGGVSYDGCGFEFKIGGSDEVGLYKNSSSEGGGDPQLVDVAAGCCSGDESTSYGRPLGGADGAFAVLPARTPGAPNSRAATPPSPPTASHPQSVPAHVLINEVADKGNEADAACAGSDWLELLNPFDSSLSLAGLEIHSPARTSRPTIDAVAAGPVAALQRLGRLQLELRARGAPE